MPRLVQVTSGSNASARVSKILEEPRALIALLGGFEIVVHGWRKVKVKRGGKAMRWEPRIVPVNAEDFNLCLYPQHPRSPVLLVPSTPSPMQPA
ncbi:hypothetical protein [Mangrovicoccus algicola]|uniref:Uncharacterized protein n=1 Tax=Mangrovicoccus algicola TaxID=2771008 RepID=A0A8J6YTH7_9RHOB|nr:hypothetical protein [Mangrovicoccus algicola]MBE3637375.1 hypothetical protein [Mangrovicoccus algicola]